MNSHEIEKLLEKYFSGESTLEDEKALREFFSRDDVPANLVKLRPYFGFLQAERSIELPNADFDARITSRLKEPKLVRLMDLRRPWIYWVSGVAASVLILVAVFVRFDPLTRPVKDTYQDPQVAYHEATKILLFVAGKFNKGASRLEPVSRIETGINSLKPVSALNKGLSEINRLEILDTTNEQNTIN